MPVSELYAGPPEATDPAPAASLGRYFFFPSLGLGDSQLHPPPEATAEATLTAAALVLRFRAWPDDLRFELDRARLPGPAAWAAPYALRSLAQPLAPAGVRYRYARRRAARAGLGTGELAAQLAGSVTITGYDARRQLLSGYYEVRAAGQPDPARAAPAGTTCTILLAGDFDNVKLRVR
ncbi:MAG TPA: hypothetical protein VFO93_13890 [Hymenobacter sp.]|uniref:hypothetical protein n=1 Tax=Hymenobacter sp. TaxID=1898978 RepID=UPI002D7ED62D|nr:hypothetical protein [Hymenobacter sp.]HET9504628.1 hypothetical protein [Hymenobacter sp.]